MSLSEKSAERCPVETTSETVTTDRKQTHRLYPSLPDMDERSMTEKLGAAAVYHPDHQSEASAVGIEVILKARILTLEKQRQELLSINEKWAKEYRTMKQHFTQKVKSLKALVRDDCCRSGETCEEGGKEVTSERNVKHKASTKTGDTDMSSKLLKAEKEVNDLRAQNRTLSREWQHQREEIKRLNKALEEALLKNRPLDDSSETLQDVWKQQAEVYKEDFLKERRDRERLKDKCLGLERNLRKAHSELCVLKPQVNTALP
ncbi:TNFAIP3-interacting protein 3-like isoform X2 [Antennarius striatus]|uniref:TNFAIP3-interacting protein 3-like isoform X2 n=1 Tax=Antennarius striatus TaxID=241820 RepID=UPI0035B393E8